MVIWKMGFGGMNWDRHIGIAESDILCPPALSFAPSKTTVLSMRAPAPTAGTSSCFSLILFWGSFSGPSFNIIPAEILLLLAGPVKDSVLKCFYKLYWGTLIAFCGFSKFCLVIWSAMCSFGSWDIAKTTYCSSSTLIFSSAWSWTACEKDWVSIPWVNPFISSSAAKNIVWLLFPTSCVLQSVFCLTRLRAAHTFHSGSFY